MRHHLVTCQAAGPLVDRVKQSSIAHGVWRSSIASLVVAAWSVELLADRSQAGTPI